MNKSKKNIFNISVIFILIVLIFIRSFVPNEISNWISAINFAGVIMAWANIHIDLYSELNSYEKIHLFTGISYSIIAILTIITILLFFGFLSLSLRTNDIITLIILLISLPSELYKKIIGNLIKKRS